MDEFDKKMSSIFNENFNTPSSYKISVNNAINKANYDNKNILNFNKIKNIAASFLIGSITLSGVTYASIKIYENIWKKPTSIQNTDFSISDYDKNTCMESSELIDIAIEKLEVIGYSNATIENYEYIKDPYSNNSLYFQAKASNNADTDLNIMLDATTGNFISFGTNLDNQPQTFRTSKKDAENSANILFSNLKYNKDDYELIKLVGNHDNEEEKSWFWTATFAKKYNNVINKYQSISINFIPEINKIIILQEINYPFDNNEIIINSNEAIEIAKNKESQLYSNNNDEANITCELSINKMNSEIYKLENNITENFKDVSEDKIVSGNKYYTENIVRNIYNVKISYNHSNRNISYYIDTTTGEIIGGEYFDF